MKTENANANKGRLMSIITGLVAIPVMSAMAIAVANAAGSKMYPDYVCADSTKPNSFYSMSAIYAALFIFSARDSTSTPGQAISHIRKFMMATFMPILYVYVLDNVCPTVHLSLKLMVGGILGAGVLYYYNQRRMARFASLIALNNGYIFIVRLLVAAGANVDAKLTANGATALYLATQNRHVNIVHFLISAGAKVDKALTTKKDLTSFLTPLYTAAHKGDLDIVQALLEARADIDKAGNTYGATALFVAASWGHLDVVKYLIVAGADKNKARTTDGATPLFIAAYWGSRMVGCIEVVKALIKGGAEVDKALTANGETPLLIAAARDHIEVARLLIDNGANLDQPSGRGATPLYFAAQNGHTAVVTVLLAAGADVGIALKTDDDANGSTPLLVAQEMGHIEIEAALLAARAGAGAAAAPATSSPHP